MHDPCHHKETHYHNHHQALPLVHVIHHYISFDCVSRIASHTYMYNHDHTMNDDTIISTQKVLNLLTIASANYKR